MQQISGLKRLFAWLLPPQRGEDEQSQRAYTVHVLALAILFAGLVSALTEVAAGVPQSAPPLLAGMGVVLVALWINRRGFTRAAGVLMILSILAVLTRLVMTGQGIHDIAITLYPVLMILISLLFVDRFSILGYFLVILSVGVVVFSEAMGWFEPQLSNIQARLADFVILSAILVVTAVSLRLVHGSLQRSLNQERRHQQALHASEARFRSLTENAPNLILRLDVQGKVLYANRALPHTEETLEGRSLYEIIPLEQQATIRQLLADVFQNGETATFEGQILNGSSDRPWFSFRLGPIREDGLITGIVMIITSLQERKLAEVKLEKRTEQLQTLNQIALAISSLHDLKGVLDEILKQLQSAMLLDVFYVGLLNENKSQVGFPIVYDAGHRYAGNPVLLSPEGWIAQVVNSSQPFLLNRTISELETAGSRHMMGDESRPSASIILVPLIVGERTIGVVSAQSYSLNAYAQEQVDFLQSAASQIAVAVDNAQLYESLGRRTEQLASLNRIGTAITSLQETDPLFRMVQDQLQTVLPLDVFYIALYNVEDNSISYPFLYDSGRYWQEPDNHDWEGSNIGRIIQKGESFIINRTLDEIAHSNPFDALGDKNKASASYLMVPLQVGNRTIGVVSTQSYTPNAYNLEHLALLQGAASQIAITIENSRLYSKLQSELAERKRSEMALRQSEARLRAIIENIPFDLWLCDTEGKYILQSGLSFQYAGDILGKRVTDLDKPVELTEAWAKLHGRVLAGESVTNEGEWLVGNELRSFVTRLAPIWDEDQMLGFVGLNIDITELKRSETVLRRYADRIETLHEIDQAVLAVRSSQEIAIAALSRLPRLLPDCSACLALVDEAKSAVQVVATYSEGVTLPGSGVLKSFHDPEHLAQLKTGEPVVLLPGSEGSLPDQVDSWDRELLQGVARAAIVVPLRYKEKLIGVLSVGAEEKEQFSEEDVAITQEIGTQLAVAINQAQLTADIQQLNAELEQRVQDRTAELEAAMMELEAFSFSVSHDLRAPLRGVIGYMAIFMEDYGVRLDAEAKEYLERVQSSALRMNQLIDELLTLSRAGRQALQLTTFNLGELFREVLDIELASQAKDRVQVTLHALPDVEADQGLLRQVCQNLVDNALKYSRNCPISQVEIGSMEETGKTVFYVRDNGVGFDMKYAPKLFTAFERLHRQDEFEGTGVGLALVKRIVQRHGGQIWVQAALNEGATFYFTLD